MKTNLNDFAKTITLQEGKKQNLSIAQIKEVLKITFTMLADMKFEDIVDVLKRYR